MICLAVAPTRIGSFDFLIPFLLEFKEKKKNLKPVILFFDNKIFLELKKNIVLFEIIKTNFIYFNFSFISHLPFKKILKFIFLLPFGAYLFLKKKNILMIRLSIVSFTEKFLSYCNSFNGKTYTYISNNTYNDLFNRYFDKKGKALKKNKDNVTLLKNHNSGDGFLINSEKGIKFLTAKGYKNFKIVGFPYLYNSFQKFIKKNTERLINTELKINLKDYQKIETILVNKFWGRWSSKNSQWFYKRLEILLNSLSKEKKKLILIRTYPIFHENLNNFIKKKNLKNIHITYAHPSSLSFISKKVYAIAQSSVFISCLSFQAPYIEISNINKKQRKMYPKGSLYSNYKIYIVDNLVKLKKLILKKNLLYISKREFINRIGHQNLKLKKDNIS